MAKGRNIVPAMPLRLDKELKAKLERLAKENGVTMTEWIREAIRRA